MACRCVSRWIEHQPWLTTVVTQLNIDYPVQGAMIERRSSGLSAHFLLPEATAAGSKKAQAHEHASFNNLGAVWPHGCWEQPM